MPHLEKPDDIDPEVLVNGTPQIQARVPQIYTTVKKQDYAVVMGFMRGVSNNIQDNL